MKKRRGASGVFLSSSVPTCPALPLQGTRCTASDIHHEKNNAGFKSELTSNIMARFMLGKSKNKVAATGSVINTASLKASTLNPVLLLPRKK